MRKYLLTLACIGCTQNTLPPITPSKIDRQTYNLEELCDTQILERDLTIHIHAHDDFWDFDPILFSYLKDGFAKYKINLHTIHSETPLQPTSLPNEIGIEICNSKKMSSRFLEFYPDDIRHAKGLCRMKGIALTKEGIALVNGNWREIYSHSKTFKRNSVIWYLAHMQNARIIFHESLHLLGLFHPGSFQPTIIKDLEVPNAMSYSTQSFSTDFPLGVEITELQIRLLHSYIAGNQTFKAFQNSGKQIDIYEQNIADDNKLKLKD